MVHNHLTIGETLPYNRCIVSADNYTSLLPSALTLCISMSVRFGHARNQCSLPHLHSVDLISQLSPQPLQALSLHLNSLQDNNTNINNNNNNKSIPIAQAKLCKNAPFCNAKESFKKLSDPDTDLDDFYVLMGNSLSKDSVAKFLRRSDQLQSRRTGY